MALIKKYGFLLIPALYWLIYLGVRLTYNGLAGEYTPDFIQSIRHDGVFIICSLLVFYIACLRVDVSDGEHSGVLFLAVILFHVAALIISLLICLWQGTLLSDVIFIWQLGTSMMMLVFIPVLTFRYA